MATHSSVLLWRLPWTEEPCGVQSMQCERPGFDPGVGKFSWRRDWPPTLVFFSGDFHGQRSLVEYSPWGHKESDRTKQLTLL